MPMRHSIIRRSLLVTAFYVFGHGFNYLLFLSANKILTPEAFGLFYISISMINVMMTPGPVLAMLFGQHFAKVAAVRGPNAVTVALSRILRVSVLWSVIAVLSLVIVLIIIGKKSGVETYSAIALIPIIACAGIICEIIRSAFQGLQKFNWFAGTWVLWCSMHYIFAMAGLYFIGTVWAGLIGSLLSATLLGSISLAGLSVRTNLPVTSGRESTLPLEHDAVVPQLLGYGLFNLLLNADVLLGYLVLSREQLGVYVASSILPKAIVTMTLPVAQVLLPVIAARANAGENARSSTVKAIATVVALATAGVLLLRIGNDMVCGSRFGIRYCDGDVMSMLALTAISLSVLRLLIVNSLAQQNVWLPLLQGLAVVIFPILIEIGTRTVSASLAMIYFIVCGGMMIIYLLVDLLSERYRAALKSESMR